MSYQSRKQKRSFRYWLRVGQRKISVFFYKFKKRGQERREAYMRYQAVTEIMQFLRKRSSYIRRNNQRINDWVDGYINQCFTTGTPITILTQWCLSKNLEGRFAEQESVFVPTRKERLLFGRDIPEVAAVFKRFGATIEWWITFNRPYLDSWRASQECEAAYRRMIEAEAKPLIEEGWLAIANWEDEILGKPSEPNSAVLKNPEQFVNREAIELRIRWSMMREEEGDGVGQSDEEVRLATYFKIACEAEEGRLLVSEASPIGGTFLLVPLELSEQYDFFTILVPDFKKRIVPVLPQYPWRAKE